MMTNPCAPIRPRRLWTLSRCGARRSAAGNQARGAAGLVKRKLLINCRYCHCSPFVMVKLKSPIQTFRNRKGAVSQNDSKQPHIRGEQLLADPLCGSASGTVRVERQHQAIG